MMPLRKVFYFILLVSLFSGLAAAQSPAAPPATAAADIVGTWRGQVNFGDQALPIVIHIAKGEADKLTVSADNPMDGTQVGGAITFADGKLHIDFDQASYDGELSADGNSFDGSITVGGEPQKCPLQRDKAN